MSEGQDHPNINRNIHPPVLLLIHLLAAFLLSWLLPLRIASINSLTWAGYVLLLAGLGLASSAVSRFTKAHTTLDPHGSVSAMVTDGPYRFSRNPIYLGFVCTLIGLPLALGNVWGAILSPLLMMTLYRFVIKHEEVYLEKKFQDVYASYRTRVRRWL
ncbi:MAG: isoprenylcysteine carboxylmethyltransferase family protein [Anaerolineales bacterium]|nr:isoprenylcysteine carboxylmethyltransferase family protein [Anaerolineae bacterium]PWB76892.1 MAG: isoprenylcysteine carboxylmethyltransferase family protein [Anaerolineales bacterium]